MRLIGISILASLFAATTGLAHYSMLLPDKPWAERGEKITFTYQYGHPFEHELSDAPKPVALMIIAPNAKTEKLDVDKLMTPIKKDGADGKKITAWQFTFTPPARGDYTFVLKTAKLKHDDDKIIEDIVKVVLHVQTQNGWNLAGLRDSLDIQPYTRPYGLLPGMVFRGRVTSGNRDNVGDRIVEIEKYNPKPMKGLPPDELITFKSRTEEGGFFSATLPGAGWWGITAPGREGERVTHWIHVDEKK